MKWVKASVTICDGKDAVDGKSADTRVTKLSKIDQQDTKEIPISPSAVDTAHMFHEVRNFQRKRRTHKCCIFVIPCSLH